MRQIFLVKIIKMNKNLKIVLLCADERNVLEVNVQTTRINEFNLKKIIHFTIDFNISALAKNIEN